jgi:hypothetical protein
MPTSVCICAPPHDGPPSPERRVLLAAGASLACVPGAAWSRPGAEPTPSQMEGPFYPVEPIPIRARLRELDGRRAQGQGCCSPDSSGARGVLSRGRRSRSGSATRAASTGIPRSGASPTRASRGTARRSTTPWDAGRSTH